MIIQFGLFPPHGVVVVNIDNPAVDFVVAVDVVVVVVIVVVHNVIIVEAI